MCLCPPVQHTSFFPCCVHYQLLNLSQCFPNIAWLSWLGIFDLTEHLLLLVTFSKRAYYLPQPQFATECPTRQLLGNVHLQSQRVCLLWDNWMKGHVQTHSDEKMLCPSCCMFCHVLTLSACLFICPVSAENEEGRRMFNRETTLAGINDILMTCHDLWKIVLKALSCRWSQHCIYSAGTRTDLFVNSKWQEAIWVHLDTTTCSLA